MKRSSENSDNFFILKSGQILKCFATISTQPLDLLESYMKYPQYSACLFLHAFHFHSSTSSGFCLSLE